MDILIVDDSAAMRQMVMRTLRQAGFVGHDIAQAGDGVEALEHIRNNPVDLVMADWNMPNMTGLELLEELRSLFDGSGGRDSRPGGILVGSPKAP